jgi:hypothetical protein
MPHASALSFSFYMEFLLIVRRNGYIAWGKANIRKLRL